MWPAQLLLLGHYVFHVLQSQVGVEVLPIGLEGYGEALVLEEKVELFVLVVLLWALAKVCVQFEQLVLLVLVPVGGQAELFVSWAEVQPLVFGDKNRA